MSDATLTSPPSFASESDRLAAINLALGPIRLTQSQLARCIAPLMVALNWFGAPKRLLSCLPEPQVPIQPSDLKLLLAENGFRLRSHQCAEWKRLGGSLVTLPVGSIALSGNSARVYLGLLNGVNWWHDGSALSQVTDLADASTLLVVEASSKLLPLDSPQIGWLNRLFLSARREWAGILFVSLIANLLILVISLFTMFVYNTVIPSGAKGTLWAMTAGAVLAIVGAWGLKLSRIHLVARLTGWAGLRISNIAMAKTLGLPMEVSSRLGVENNLIRLRSLEGVRQWFGGAGGAINADFPFVFIFLLVIALLGGWIVLVPLVGMALFAITAWPLTQLMHKRSTEVSHISRKLGEMTSVITKRLRPLRGVRASALWNQHLTNLIAQSVTANRDFSLINALSQTIGQALSMLIVLSTMGVGIGLVLNNDMTTGGLIATMMLIWRVTTPTQQFFASQMRISQLVDSGHQLERLLISVGEASNPQITSPVSDLQPTIEADRLYYRYSADREPALSGVSFKVEAGKILAVVGPNGAGKTTLMEILSGARLPQNGRVRIADRDIRQFDPADYRAWHGYMPQNISGVLVNLSASLRLRCPTSTDEALRDALTKVAGPNWFRYFGCDSAESGLNVHITPWREDRDAVRGRYIVRMAAAILDNPPLILMDDPLGDRDPALDGYFIQLLETLRGKSTVILATHRVDLIQRSDLIAVLSDGALAHFGPVAPPQTEDKA